MPKQRRTTVRRAPVQSRRRVTSRRQSWFSVLALLTVVAMLIGAVGSAVVLDLFNGDDGGDEINVGAGEEDQIEEEFRENMAARPDDPEAIATLANYLMVSGEVTEGRRLYERALQIAPDNIEIRLDFARDLAAAGSYRDAELQFTKVIEADPIDGLPLLDLAQLYREWSPPRLDDAIATYQRAISLDSDSIVAQVAMEELIELGVATPMASPTAMGAGTPAP